MNRINRAAEIEKGENSTFRVSVSSEKPCRDFLWINGKTEEANLILSHAPEAIDMSYIAEGIALRNRHSSCRGGGKLVARAMNPVIEDGKLVSHEIVWAENDEAKEVKADVESGALRDLSIEADYRSEDLIVEGKDENGVLQVRAVRWMPIAAAFVDVGADPSAGVNRAMVETSNPAEVPPVEEPKATITKEQIMPEVTRGDDEVVEILALARNHKISNDVVTRWFKENKPMNEIKDEVLAMRSAEAPKEVAPILTPKEAKNYSISKAIRAMLGDHQVDAKFEQEVSDECAKRLGKSARGMMVPHEVILRAFTTGNGNGAGLTSTEHLANNFIDALRSKMILDKLGVMILDGLNGSVDIPKLTGTMTAYHLGETDSNTASNPTVGNVSLSSKTIAGYCDITRKLLNQSSPAADMIVENDLTATIARGMQDAFFNGAGTSGKPTGLFSAISGSEFTVTVPGAPTWAELCAAIGALDLYEGNDNLKWVAAPQVFARLRAIKRDTYAAGWMAEILGGQKYIADIPCFTTSALSDGYAVVGDFSNAIIGMWGALDLTVDPYALSTTGGLRIVGLQDYDVAIRHTEGFAFSNDLSA